MKTAFWGSFFKKLHEVEDEFDLLNKPMVKPCFLYFKSGGDHIRRNWRDLGRVVNECNLQDFLGHNIKPRNHKYFDNIKIKQVSAGPKYHKQN